MVKSPNNQYMKDRYYSNKNTECSNEYDKYVAWLINNGYNGYSKYIISIKNNILSDKKMTLKRTRQKIQELHEKALPDSK